MQKIVLVGESFFLLFIILNMCTAHKNIPTTVMVHVSHWHCRYGGECRYPDTSFKHCGANGAPEVPPVQRPNDVARHNVCCTCRGSLDEFATGSHQFSGIRNMKLEKISFWSNLSCPYLECGCQMMVPVEVMADHLSICVYKKATCQLNKTMSIVCAWEGLLKDVVFHCKESHKSRFAECEFFKSSSTARCC